MVARRRCEGTRSREFFPVASPPSADSNSIAPSSHAPPDSHVRSPPISGETSGLLDNSIAAGRAGVRQAACSVVGSIILRTS